MVIKYSLAWDNAKKKGEEDVKMKKNVPFDSAIFLNN